MEIKNNQILLIESSLNELHKIINDKDSKIVQLQKDKDYLKDTITNNKYEFESMTDENEKLKKQIKLLYDKQNDLKENIQEHEINLKLAENVKRHAEKMIQSKNDSLIHSMEEKLFDLNEELKQKELKVKEIQSRNEYLHNIIEVHKADEEVLKYDNSNQKKQIKMLRENIHNLEKDLKRHEYDDLKKSTKKDQQYSSNFNTSNNVMLENLEKKLLKVQNNLDNTKKETNEKKTSLTEEEILKNNLGLN